MANPGKVLPIGPPLRRHPGAAARARPGSGDDREPSRHVGHRRACVASPPRSVPTIPSPSRAAARAGTSAAPLVRRRAASCRRPPASSTYRPDEMTVRVGAGTTVADLHDALGGRRASARALPERGGTVGGALAVGEHDVRRARAGPAARRLLQVRYVAADGRLVTGGGPTVKNVTGFDLCRAARRARSARSACSARSCCGPTRVPAVRAVARRPAASIRSPLRRRRATGPPPSCGTATTHLGAARGPRRRRRGRRPPSPAIGGSRRSTGPPTLPPHRWSLPPGEIADADGRPGPVRRGDRRRASFAGRARRAPVARRPDGRRTVRRRLKDGFDPTGRLNPGRRPRRERSRRWTSASTPTS